MLTAIALTLACSVTDGDTLRCGDERIRLTGIDAPELSPCPRWRKCAPGDAKASKQSLARAIQSGKLIIRRFGKDRYGRTLAVVYADGRNIACDQMAAGHAIYRRDWDNRGIVARDCGL